MQVKDGFISYRFLFDNFFDLQKKKKNKEKYV